MPSSSASTLGHARLGSRSMAPRSVTRRRRSKQLAGGLIHAGAILFPDARELLQQIGEARPAPPRCRREVGAAVERLRAPASGTPSSASRRSRSSPGRTPCTTRSTSGRSSRSTLIDTKSRFSSAAISVAHERLVLHHVAPVAGRIADREKDRLVFRPGPREGLVPPGIPVDGIAGMLQQVGTALLRQTIHGPCVLESIVHHRYRKHRATIAGCLSRESAW